MQAETPGPLRAFPKSCRVLPRIAVVGVGALGSEFCWQLAEAGAPDVLLIDPDCLEERNLHASRLYRQAAEASMGGVLLSNKAELTASLVERHFGLRWQAIPEEIADVGLRRLENCDVICCCGDSSLCRVETVLAARTLGLPMLDGGVFSEGVEEGRVTWFSAYPEAACYLCGLLEARRADLLGYAASASLGCAAPQVPPMSGALSAVECTAAAMIDFLQSSLMLPDQQTRQSEALRLKRKPLAGPGQRERADWTAERIRLVRSDTCPWHEASTAPLVHLPWQTTLSVAFAGNTAGCILQCMWPVCLVAKCCVCGEEARPYRRVAWVRRRGQCSTCGASGSLEPLECLDTIAQKDAAAACTPRQLGMPDEHLYHFRPVMDGALA